MHNEISVELMLELARDHERKAKVLWKRADRCMSATVKASLMLQADAEQRMAVVYTMRVRNLRPQPMRISA